MSITKPLIEQEWRVCYDPHRMMDFVLGNTFTKVSKSTPKKRPGQVSDRKLRLYACGCFERVRKSVSHPLALTALEVAERFADGLATKADLDKAHETASKARPTFEKMQGMSDKESVAALETWNELFIGLRVAEPSASVAAWYCTISCTGTPGMADRADPKVVQTKWDEKVAQAALLRDVIGFAPYRSMAADPAWLTSDVTLLARQIYETKAFDQMPVLADALQESGCTNEDVLTHCRSGGPHIRGCWALDLILGKN